MHTYWALLNCHYAYMQKDKQMNAISAIFLTDDFNDKD